jgi:hypothetical protein
VIPSDRSRLEVSTNTSRSKYLYPSELLKIGYVAALSNQKEFHLEDCDTNVKDVNTTKVSVLVDVPNKRFVLSFALRLFVANVLVWQSLCIEI